MSRSIPIALLLVAQLALGGLAVAAWYHGRATSPAPPSSARPTPGPAIAKPATIESAYPLALARARQWRSDAQLLSAGEQIDSPQDPVPLGAPSRLPGSGWLIYVFVASWHGGGDERHDAATLSLLIERNSAVIYVEQTTPWETKPAPLPAAAMSLPVSSTLAALTADGYVGGVYRRACPRWRHLSRVALDMPATAPPSWSITYQDERYGDKSAVRLRIAATTGQIVDFSYDAQPCDEGAATPVNRFRRLT